LALGELALGELALGELAQSRVQHDLAGRFYPAEFAEQLDRVHRQASW
jgi:hypothetical protein